MNVEKLRRLFENFLNRENPDEAEFRRRTEVLLEAADIGAEVGKIIQSISSKNGYVFPSRLDLVLPSGEEYVQTRRLSGEKLIQEHCVTSSGMFDRNNYTQSTGLELPSGISEAPLFFADLSVDMKNMGFQEGTVLVCLAGNIFADRYGDRVQVEDYDELDPFNPQDFPIIDGVDVEIIILRDGQQYHISAMDIENTLLIGKTRDFRRESMLLDAQISEWNPQTKTNGLNTTTASMEDADKPLGIFAHYRISETSLERHLILQQRAAQLYVLQPGSAERQKSEDQNGLKRLNPQLGF